MNSEATIEELTQKTPTQLLELIRNNTRRDLTDEIQAKRAVYVGALNYYFYRETAKLSRRIYWLNVVLAILTFALVCDAIIAII